MRAIEFWFEFASTYSYPAAMRIERLARQAAVTVRWRAFLLGPIFQAQGWQDSPFNLQPVKGRYMWRDLERICAREQLPLRRPSVFPRKAILPARIACAFEDAPWLPEFIRRTYTANFGEDRDIGDAAVIAQLLAELDLPLDIIEHAQTPPVKLKLRERTMQAQQRGVFGAPTVFVGDEMFWGNDRLEDALRWASRGNPPAA